ncbi:MAG TPA: hypothetical protein VKB51_12965 [bacterium]|nr:hypothetical protein [bacterium]
MIETQTVLTLLEQKLSLLRDMLSVTQRSLLLVDLDGLTPLLRRKDELIGEIRLLDEALDLHPALPVEVDPVVEEMREVVQSVLENERTLELRIEQEQARLRQELRDFDQETRLKQYLERTRPKGGAVNLKK